MQVSSANILNTSDVSGQKNYALLNKISGNLENGKLAKQGLNNERAMAAAKEFEAVFLSEMMGHMFGDVEADPMFGGGFAEEMWKGMLTEEYGREFSKSNNLGISPLVMREIIKLQEGK